MSATSEVLKDIIQEMEQLEAEAMKALSGANGPAAGPAGAAPEPTPGEGAGESAMPGGSELAEGGVVDPDEPTMSAVESGDESEADHKGADGSTSAESGPEEGKLATHEEKERESRLDAPEGANARDEEEDGRLAREIAASMFKPRKTERKSRK